MTHKVSSVHSYTKYSTASHRKPAWEKIRNGFPEEPQRFVGAITKDWNNSEANTAGFRKFSWPVFIYFLDPVNLDLDPNHVYNNFLKKLSIFYRTMKKIWHCPFKLIKYGLQYSALYLNKKSNYTHYTLLMI